jgi:hypothetical protein
LLGYAQTLQDEVSQFGIHTVLFDIGSFRTRVADPDNLKLTIPHIADYTEMWTFLTDHVQSMHGNQPGDPRKGAERMIDVLKQEGRASGKAIPKRIPIGPDAAQAVKETCLATLKVCEEWEELSASTDFEGPKQE